MTKSAINILIILGITIKSVIGQSDVSKGLYELDRNKANLWPQDYFLRKVGFFGAFPDFDSSKDVTYYMIDVARPDPKREITALI